MKRIAFIVLVLATLAFHLYLVWKPRPRPIHLRPVAFAELPGWNQANPKKSFQAFQLSCKAFIKQSPDRFVGSKLIDVQVKDWHPICQEALAIDTQTAEGARAFFQKWFRPVEFFNGEPVRGLFTGYYMLSLQGSPVKTEKYKVPIYATPDNLISVNLALFDPHLKNRRIVGRVQGKHFVPFYTRAQITQGVLKNHAAIIAWIENPVDQIFLEIQGSGIIQMTDGRRLVINYAAENGAPYKSIAKVLIDEGVMNRDNASMQRIKHYLLSHPEKNDQVLNQNKSFVFFEKLPHDSALGSQGVALTPGYSLAIDRKWIPMGAPIWLTTTRPVLKTAQDTPFHRLMIAQDTGGAIKGAVRGDVYWGAGERATAIAGRMKNPGHYWLLLPETAFARWQAQQV